jgi:hypothetical protein
MRDKKMTSEEAKKKTYRRSSNRRDYEDFMKQFD